MNQNIWNKPKLLKHETEHLKMGEKNLENERWTDTIVHGQAQKAQCPKLILDIFLGNFTLFYDSETILEDDL